MLREIYQKAESGKQHTAHSRNRTTIHTSSPANCKPRTCFLFTGWGQYKSSLPAASPVTSPTTTKYLHPSFAGDEQRPAHDSETSHLSRTNSSNNRNQSPIVDKRKIVIEDENRSELVGHVLTEQPVIDGNNNTSDIQTEATDLNNLTNLNGSFNNSKESTKRRSSSRSFGRTKSAVKKQLSRLLSDKESGDLANRPLANLEHTGHRTSILVSLRAASILLPLYGLHYLVFVYRIETSVCWLSELYHYCSITLDGLQGMLVSILFCFATNEVIDSNDFKQNNFTRDFQTIDVSFKVKFV